MKQSDRTSKKKLPAKTFKFRKQQKDTENHLLQTMIRFPDTQMLHTKYTINSCQWYNVKFVVSILRATTEPPYISNTLCSQWDIFQFRT